jgi:hypothetical protein
VEIQSPPDAGLIGATEAIGDTSTPNASPVYKLNCVRSFLRHTG